MSDPIVPWRLLRQARALAGFDAGRGRPSPTNHRRAVSAAYYALFHAVTQSAVARVLPDGVANDEERYRARRWIDHADISAACRWVEACALETTPTTTPRAATGRAHGVWELFSTPAGTGRTADVPSALNVITRAFLDLQRSRHIADYDHLASFPKADAKSRVEAATRAVDALHHNLEDRHVQRFLALLLFRAARLS